MRSLKYFVLSRPLNAFCIIAAIKRFNGAMHESRSFAIFDVQ